MLLNNFAVESSSFLTTAFSIAGGVTYFLWPLLTGHKLYQLLPEKISLNYNLFMINSFVWLAAYVIIMVVSDGNGMSFSGIEALPFLYVIYAFLFFLAFPVRVLRSIEKGKSVNLGEYIGDFFLVVFFPIGVWFLQPRVNRVADSVNSGSGTK